jgi:hypothetical protein
MYRNNKALQRIMATCFSWYEIIEEVQDKKVFALNKNNKTNTCGDVFSDTSGSDLKSESDISEDMEHSEDTYDELLKMDVKKVPSVPLLIHICKLAEDAKYYIKKNKSIDIEKTIGELELLECGITALQNKLGLEQTSHILPDGDELVLIPRSSYKFCDYNFRCEFNYGTKSKGCRYQHFVYDLVNSDMDALKKHLLSCKKCDKSPNITEIIKCINTIAYVLNHMKDELAHLCHCNKSDISKLHKEKNRIRRKITKTF